MARPKSWISKLPLILQRLEADTAEHYTRRAVEEIFDVSASQASEVMEVAGYSRKRRPGIDSLVSRTNLLHYARHSPEAQAALQEIERREKLAKRLRDSEEALKFRKVRLRVTRVDEWSSFVDIPNVSVRPGMIQVAFTPGDPIDAMDQLYRFAMAVGNEWDEFVRMCKEASGASGGGDMAEAPNERKVG